MKSSQSHPSHPRHAHVHGTGAAPSGDTNAQNFEEAHALRHGHPFAHSDHSHKPSGSETRLRTALALTVGFMCVEVIGGYLSGSLALIAGAGHMLTDAAALMLALFALRISRRAADPRRSYGYGRMQVLAAFVNGLSLLALSAWIVIEAVQRIFTPTEVMGKPMLVIAMLGLMVNLLAFWILHRGGNDDGHNHRDLNLQGAIAHVLGDLLGSAAAIVAALIILFTGWLPADPLLSVLVAGLIIRSALTITRESAHILLQGAPERIDLEGLESGLRSAVPGLQGIHHVHSWSLTPAERIMTLHAELAPGANGDAVTQGVIQYLKAHKGIGHVTVQVEQSICGESVHSQPPHADGSAKNR